MNTKTKYMIPVFAAVFAMIFVVSSPYVMADDANGTWGGKHFKGANEQWGGDRHMGPKGPMGPHAITIDGFSGSIAIPQDITKDTRDSLKDQVVVTLLQAVNIASDNGFVDGMSANLGVVDDGAGNKYLVWTITSIDRDAETGAVTCNVFVVDARDPTKFAQTTQTFDHPMKGDGQGPKVKGFQKFADNLDPETQAKFQDLMDQLRQAHQNGDTETAKNLKDQVHQLLQSLQNENS